MDIFYEFTSNEERDAALADAAYEMADAKYKRDMMIIEANYEYNLKCAEYKCLTENGSFDDYAKMIMFATEDANEKKDDTQKSILQAIADFFKRIFSAIQYIFTGKIKDDAKVNKAPDAKQNQGNAKNMLDRINKVWSSFTAKVTLNQEMDDGSFDKLMDDLKSIATPAIVVHEGYQAVKDIREMANAVKGYLTTTESGIVGWFKKKKEERDQATEAGDEKKSNLIAKVEEQGKKLWDLIKPVLDKVKEMVESVKSAIKGLLDKIFKKGDNAGENTGDQGDAETPAGGDSSTGKTDDVKKTDDDGEETKENNDAEKPDDQTPAEQPENPAKQEDADTSTGSGAAKEKKPNETPAATPKSDNSPKRYNGDITLCKGKTKNEIEKMKSDAENEIKPLKAKGSNASDDEKSKIQSLDQNIKDFDKALATFKESTYSDFDVDELFAEFGL